MKIHTVTHGPRGNRFCGPAALSALTGKATTETAAMLRHVSGRRQITGTTTGEMADALDQFNYGILRVYDDTRAVKERMTLTGWLRLTQADRVAGRVYLVEAGNHWMVISGRRYVDSITEDIVSIKDKQVMRRARVRAAFEIERKTR